jgi:hypothetical protein
MTPATLAVIAPYQDDEEVLEAASQALSIVEQARGLDIVDEATNGRALTMLSQARKYTKEIDALRHGFVDPLNAHIKDINAYFADKAAPAKEADTILAQKTSRYRAAVQEAARKEQERLRLLQEKRQERAVAKAEERGVEPPPVVVLIPTVAPPAKTVQTGSGSITFVERRTFEITDAAAVPRDLCCPDEKKIGQMVRAKAWEPQNAPAGIRIIVTQEPSVR